MTLSRETTMDLMAYADDELDDEGRARVEALLARSDEARRVVASIASPALGAWLEQAADDHAAKADTIADAVMLRVAAESHKVVRLDSARTKGRRAAWTIGVVALAVAAAVTLYVRSQPGSASKAVVAQVDTAETTAQAAPAAAVPVAPTKPIDLNAPEGIEVNEVEAPAQTVSVYYLEPTKGPTTAGKNSVVIEIGDDTTGPGAAGGH